MSIASIPEYNRYWFNEAREEYEAREEHQEALAKLKAAHDKAMDDVLRVGERMIVEQAKFDKMALNAQGLVGIFNHSTNTTEEKLQYAEELNIKLGDRIREFREKT